MIEHWSFTYINIDLLKLFVTSEPSCTFFYLQIILQEDRSLPKRAVSFCLIFNSFPPSKKNLLTNAVWSQSDSFLISIWPKRTKTDQNTVFPQITAGAIISFFASIGGNYLREAIISNIAHWKSYPINILFYYPIK